MGLTDWQAKVDYIHTKIYSKDWVDYTELRKTSMSAKDCDIHMDLWCSLHGGALVSLVPSELSWSPAHETWSSILSPWIPRISSLFETALKFLLKDNHDNRSTVFSRDYNSQVIKHREFWVAKVAWINTGMEHGLQNLIHPGPCEKGTFNTCSTSPITFKYDL